MKNFSRWRSAKLEHSDRDSPHAIIVSLRCGSFEHDVHADLLAAASPSSTRACLRYVPLDKEVPGAIRALVEYLQTGEYDDEDLSLDDWPNHFEMSSMALNIYVHALAQKHGISALAALAKAKFETLAAAEYWRKSFAHAAKEAYTRFAPYTIEIQKSIVNICCSTGVARLAVLGPKGLTAEQFCVCGNMCELARDLPKLRQDLMEGVVMNAECALQAPKWI